MRFIAIALDPVGGSKYSDSSGGVTRTSEMRG